MAFFQNKKEDPTQPGSSGAVPLVGNAAAPMSASDDIFQGLGENFFRDTQAPAGTAPKKKDPLEIGSKVLDIGMKVAIVAAIVFAADSSVRNMETPGFFESLPVCDYLSFGVGNFDNTDCKTVVQITADKTAERDEVESTIASNLLVLVPKRLEAGDALNSPEVQFIKERTGDSRVSFEKVITEFKDIVNASAYKGEDIECTRFTFNEKGDFNVSCEFYGDSLDASTFKESRSSRMTALAFLARLDDSEFRIQNYPKALDIQKYSTADVGIRSTFSTVTKLSLNLRYVPSANGNRP